MNPNQKETDQLLSYRQKFEAELHRILEYWKTYAPDEKTGGFHGAVNLENQIVPDAVRSCVLNARILWTFSAAALAFPDMNYDWMAKRAYKVLMHNFKDPEYEGFYMELTADNQPSDTVKHTYVQAFVLYALSKYYEYSQDEKVLEELRIFFFFLDGQAKDPNRPGYLEGFSRDWKPILQNRMADENDPKSMNTHLHLLEAYAAVYKVWPNEMVRMRLSQILSIFQDQIIRQDGHLGIFFDLDFVETDLSKSICSFGHDIEASWLIKEAIDILDIPGQFDSLEPLLNKMADSVFREGLDQDGGLFLESTRFGSHIRTNKHWWLQAELLVGEMNAFEETRDWKYWELLKKSWKFIYQHVIDHNGGEWFAKVKRSGVPYIVEPADDPSPYYRNDWKIDPWKCPYHNGRAMLELISRIDKVLKN